jgi:hypothetical protein
VWHLTTTERKRILLSNIYGVDIDSQAVEVTKLSLLLKVLEDETAETLNRQIMLFHERALPNLGSNIKCGNSLIGPDFYDGKQMNMLATEEAQRVNVFDWQAEFSEIFKAGGFDAVIGNPPYGAKLSSDEINFLRKKYSTAEYQIDTYPLFIEKAHQIGNSKGYFGMIIPSAWVASKYDQELRKHISTKTKIINMVIAPKNTFVSATVETIILILQNNRSETNNFIVERWDMQKAISYIINQDVISINNNYILPIYTDPIEYEIINKIFRSSDHLSIHAKAVWGVKIYQKGKGNPLQNGLESVSKKFHSNCKTKESHMPLLGGKDINRFSYKWSGAYVDYGIWLAEPRTPDWFLWPRILIREVTANGTIQATIVDGEYVFSNSVDGVRLINSHLSLIFILGIINSKLISFIHLNTSANAFKGAFPKVLIKDILNFPIPKIDFANPNEKKMHDWMVTLVEQMLSLHKQLTETKTGHEQTLIQRQIDATDHQIDKLVYELYELTPEEIAIVEGGK